MNIANALAGLKGVFSVLSLFFPGIATVQNILNVISNLTPAQTTALMEKPPTVAAGTGNSSFAAVSEIITDYVIPAITQYGTSTGFTGAQVIADVLAQVVKLSPEVLAEFGINV